MKLDCNSDSTSETNNTKLNKEHSFCRTDGQCKTFGKATYNISEINGQRRYEATNQKCEIPERGCEIFIVKIPKDCFENELIPIFETAGPIFEFRIMVDFNGINRGYGFCIYHQRESASAAVDRFNNYEIRPKRYLGVCLSIDNRRLFVGGIPKTKTNVEILTEMKKYTDGVTDVIAYPNIGDKSKNRGFAFVEYESHKAAYIARRKMIQNRVQLWNQQTAVDWAEPEREVSDEIMQTVKILYVRNLMLSTTEETLRTRFQEACSGPSGCIERVKKLKDYAFVHFTTRELAKTALEKINYTDIDGATVVVCWAKPPEKSDKRTHEVLPDSGYFGLQTKLLNDAGHSLAYFGPSLTYPDYTALSASSTKRYGKRTAAGIRNCYASRLKRSNMENLDDVATMYNLGHPQYFSQVHDVGTADEKRHIYSAQVYLAYINIRQTSIGYYNSVEDAKNSAAEAALRIIFQTMSSLAMEGQTQNCSATCGLQAPFLNYITGSTGSSLMAPIISPQINASPNLSNLTAFGSLVGVDPNLLANQVLLLSTAGIVPLATNPPLFALNPAISSISYNQGNTLPLDDSAFCEGSNTQAQGNSSVSSLMQDSSIEAMNSENVVINEFSANCGNTHSIVESCSTNFAETCFSTNTSFETPLYNATVATSKVPYGSSSNDINCF